MAVLWSGDNRSSFLEFDKLRVEIWLGHWSETSVTGREIWWQPFRRSSLWS